MIALLRQNQADGTVESDHEQFLAMLPRIRYLAMEAFRRLGAEAREEMTAEVVALAYGMFARLVRQGKQDLAYATPLGRFAIRQARAGRRVGCRLNKYDVTSDYCQGIHGFTVRQLGDGSPPAGDWRQLVFENRTAGPDVTAACRIDMLAWLDRQSPRNRCIAKALAVGESTGAVARRFRLTPGRISQLRGLLKTDWQCFQVGKLSQSVA